jgi:hypothetical protein
LRIAHLFVAAAAFVGATAANAAVNVSFTGGAGVQPGEIVFATFDGGLPTYGGVSGSGYVVQSGSNGEGADPAVAPTGDPYLSVLGGGTATFNFGAGIFSLGLDYGSADPYNTFILSFAEGPDQIFTGSQIIASADGNQSDPRTNGRLTFTSIGGNSITGLTLQSSANSLEVDNLGTVAAVPEPATWALMLIGFGAVGSSMRRRRGTGVIQQMA